VAPLCDIKVILIDVSSGTSGRNGVEFCQNRANRFMHFKGAGIAVAPLLVGLQAFLLSAFS